MYFPSWGKLGHMSIGEHTKMAARHSFCIEEDLLICNASDS